MGGQSSKSQLEEPAIREWLQAAAALEDAIRKAQKSPGLGERSNPENLDGSLYHARNMINQLSDPHYYVKVANAVRNVATLLVYIDQDDRDPSGRAAALRGLRDKAYEIRVPMGQCGPLEAAAACRDSAALLRRATALIGA
jgi:hypothetical protein